LDYFYRIVSVLIILFIVQIPFVQAQYETKNYEILPAPDLWYNNVDGIRIGLRLKGQVPGTFEEGPHRLDAGFWLGTWIPVNPFSYYISYTEPILAISDYGSEGNIQFVSSIREGFQRHAIRLNKRWQKGFDERDYSETGLLLTYQQRYNNEYTPFPILWDDKSQGLIETYYRYSSENILGRIQLFSKLQLNVIDEIFPVARLSVNQNVDISSSFNMNLRGFLGVAGSESSPQYLFMRSQSSAIQQVDAGLTRSKGTIPVPWIDSGIVQLAGGANLRGYTYKDINSLNDGLPELFSSMASVNLELDYPNPLNILFNKIPMVSEFLKFRSYIFFDAGKSLQIRETESNDLFADAGPGFSLSLNIPDYLGKPRGFVLRYDMPLWLSTPGDEDSFKFRHVIGIGAVVSF
jgi:hypothetical protein